MLYIKSSSLVNIRLLSIELLSTNSNTDKHQFFNLLKFPHLESFKINYHNDSSLSNSLELPVICDFLINHPDVTNLCIDFDIINETKWEELFLNPSALPILSKLIFTPNMDFSMAQPRSKFITYNRRSQSNTNYQTIVNTLATTIATTNQPRPLQFIELNNANSNFVIYHPLSSIPTLTHTEIYTNTITTAYINGHHQRYKNSKNEKTISSTSSGIFQRLHTFEVTVCGCTTPEIWFKLLQLFNCYYNYSIMPN